MFVRQGENERDEEQLGKLRSALRLKEGVQLQNDPREQRSCKGFLLFADEGTGCLKEDSIGKYSLSLLNQSLSHAYVNQAISAVKSFMQHVYVQFEAVVYVKAKEREEAA